MFSVIPNTLALYPIITFMPKFSALCTIGISPFNGNLEIEYIPNEKLLEFESFEDYLFEISTESFTVESLCVHIFNVLIDELAPFFLKVKVYAETIKHAPAIVELSYSYPGETT